MIRAPDEERGEVPGTSQVQWKWQLRYKYPARVLAQAAVDEAV
jgi:hypothetical protein